MPAKRSTLRVLGAALLVALLCLCLLPAASPAAKRQKPKPLYWGAWIGPQMTGTAPPFDMSGVSAFESITGKSLSLIQFSSPFADCKVNPCAFYRFPTPAMNNVRAYGAIPVLSWASVASPWVPGVTTQPDFQLADITEGRYDAYIAQFADEARIWGHPFFLRFNWEMNGDWFPWAEGVNGNKPGQFVAAWRHVHDIFNAVGAANATWVWCPFADANKDRFKKIRSLYPGHGYVDWTCMDGYNWGKTGVVSRPWRSFDEIFEPTYKLLTTKIATKKPVLLGEMASGSRGGHKADWIGDMFAKLPTKYPKVRGMVYFDSYDRGINWPIETSPKVTSVFAAGIRRGIYKGNRYGELATSPIPPPQR